MLDETPAQLVAHLTHQNGWWRDTAQQLLVQRQDKSVVPALQSLVRSPDNLVARFHALWTLEGLGALDAALVREQLKDPNPRMRVQAIRASETLYKAANRSFADDYRALTKDPDPDVALQAMLTASLFKLPNLDAIITETLAASSARGVTEIGKLVQQRLANAATAATLAFSPAQQEQMKEGETIYRNLCSTCHGEDARGVALTDSKEGAMMGPPLAGSPRVTGHRDYVIKTLLHGLTGPLAGQTYTQVMLPMGAQNDQWIANIASFIRNEFGNSAPFVSPEEVARIRAATAGRKGMWTFGELEGGIPRLLPVDPGWKATASHNAERAQGGLTLAAWTTGVPQQAGMWFQVEMPQAANLSEIQFDSGAPGGGGRGRGGRGAPPGARGAGPGAARGAAAAAPAGQSPQPAAAPAGTPAAAPAAAPTGRAGAQAASAPQQSAVPPAGRGGPPVFGSFPLAYRVQLSMDGKSWSAPVAEGKGSPATTIVTFRPAQAKFVRVTQMGAAADALPWSVLNFRAYAAGK
jgi:mono/diheme cytochrome c family protein